MKDRGFGQVVITKKGEASVVGGHPWIYDTEVTPQGTLEDGAIVEVLSQKGRWLGAGFYNSHSKIRVRLLSRNANDTFDAAFSGGVCNMPGHTARLCWPRRSFPAAGLFSARRINCQD